MSSLNSILFPPAFLEEESYENPFVDPNRVQTKSTVSNAQLEQDLNVKAEVETYTESRAKVDYSPISIPKADYSSSDEASATGICLAEACGNCALAFGSPLYCALKEIEVPFLACCSEYLSPYKLIK